MRLAIQKCAHGPGTDYIAELRLKSFDPAIVNDLTEENKLDTQGKPLLEYYGNYVSNDFGVSFKLYMQLIHYLMYAIN